MPELEVAGATLYYETEGRVSDPALLLIHAGLASLRMWDPLVPELATDHYVIRYDTRGYGSTVSTEAAYSNRTDAIDLLDHLGIVRVTVIGCSRGGSIGIDLALEYPDRIVGLVTIGSAPGGCPPPQLSAREDELFAAISAAFEEGDLERAHDLEVEAWAFGPSRTPADVAPSFAATAYALHRANLARADENPRAIPLDPPAFGRLDALDLPALIMVGDLDIGAELRHYDYLLDAIPGADGCQFAGAAHLPSVEYPDEFEAVVRGWLADKRL
ncbi:alpha/beta fold hydrolase [Lacisediminihabitans changchengi]|uniref:Alpha/beta fold hydrolase n=1 Tax=Lacisediminihabitans changchengi TaxID=2787634 RepID=A0A934SV47_9MICO|nr:alpha/beta fold hydrolase [Lacisediminihabitans changchengi]MBK4348599.1 alpha/beta fold hydrolase [Lacisediminihabitans changchengi]